MPISKKSVRGSYPLEVSFQKTTHLIFPNKIVYVDLGSDAIIADKSDPTQNILRVKANIKGFSETSLAVITEDGKFYSFLVNYEDNPEKLNISIANNIEFDEEFSASSGMKKSTPEDIILPENTMNEGDLEQTCLEVAKLKRFIKTTGITRMKMSMTLDGVYIKDKTLFLQFKINNHSEIDFTIDFMKFYIHDIDVAKRMAYQEIEVKSEFEYNKNISWVSKNKSLIRVVALPLVTFPDDKIMSVELYEKFGGRHLKFEIDNEIIVNGKAL
ncbi:conjugative transposon protein TraN [Emticicia oligotrophica]|nr:conjugative transposon protein TraN [Emticicia oligotrophica]